MAAHQASPSLGFSRQEHWSGFPFPSPMHESEKWKWSRSIVSDSSDPWTAAYQAPPSMGFSRQKYWSGVPLPSPWHVISSQQIFAERIDECEAPCDLASAALSDLISCPFPLGSLLPNRTQLLPNRTFLNPSNMPYPSTSNFALFSLPGVLTSPAHHRSSQVSTAISHYSFFWSQIQF